MDVMIASDLWGEDADAVIATWLFKSGEWVSVGAVLAEIMYEKASMEVISPAAGRLTILLEAENPVRQGQLIARIEV